MRFTTTVQLAGVLTAAVLAGCSTASKNTTAPQTTPTQADAQTVAVGIQSSIESSIQSFLGGVSPILPAGAHSRSVGTMPYLRLAHIPANLVHGRDANAGRVPIGIRGAPSCVTTVPATPSDQDADGVPDTVTMTAGPGCTMTNDTTTITVSGSMDLGDPTPTTPDANYVATVNQLTFGVTSGANTASVALNGTASVTETTGSLSEDNQLTITFASSGAQTVNVSYAQNWMAVFSFTGSQPTANTGLPAGSLTLNGTTNYTATGKAFALAISTPTPLSYDPMCTTASQITAGVVKAVFTGATGTAFVTVTWSGCQDPTVQFTTQ